MADCHGVAMRAWIVGVFCALLGGFAVWTGATEGAWWFAGGGIALLAASLAHMARPSRKTMGLIEVCWGALILGHAARSGQGLSFDSARASGSSAALVVACILVFVGIFHLVRARPPAKVPS